MKKRIHARSATVARLNSSIGVKHRDLAERKNIEKVRSNMGQSIQEWTK